MIKNIFFVLVFLNSLALGANTLEDQVDQLSPEEAQRILTKLRTKAFHPIPEILEAAGDHRMGINVGAGRLAGLGVLVGCGVLGIASMANAESITDRLQGFATPPEEPVPSSVQRNPAFIVGLPWRTVERHFHPLSV